MSACYSQEPQAPERAFTPGDLLIDGDVIGPAWQASKGFLPTGDELVTPDSVARRFWAPNVDTKSPAAAEQVVYRYLSAGVAQRKFEKVSPVQWGILSPASDWTYKSPIAEQWLFGCGPLAGNVGQICVWSGHYEEFIVAFSARMIPGEPMLSFADMERVVRAIDGKMSDHLGIPLPPEAPTP